MFKIAKNDRIEMILAILRRSERPLSISEIFKSLANENVGEISRKTVQRDLRVTLERGTVRACVDSTLYELSACPASELRLQLSNEEATYLVVVLPAEHSVNQRLRKMMGL